MTEKVWVLDSSALFRIKSVVPADQQWELFEGLKGLVLAGHVAIARQVFGEARNVRHHDAPEIWLLGISQHLQHPRDCSLATHAKVMAAVGSRLVDIDAESDQADPYVVALALDLQTVGHEATVVTEDRIDRPPMISLWTACRELGVPVQQLDEFLAILHSG